MTRFYYDDLSSEIAYSTSWVIYTNSTNPSTAQWYNTSFHSCAADSSTRRGIGCNATFTFQGPGSVYMVGDHNPDQRLFYCILDDGESSLPWKVYNASTLSSPAAGSSWSVNKTRCAVSGLQDKQYSLTMGQWREDGNSNGVTLDYVVVDNATEPSTTVTWSSDFVSAEPLSQYAWTTATQSALPGSTTTSSAPPTSTPSEDQSSGGGTNGTAIGVGVGVGVGGAVGLALIAGWWFWRRRSRSKGEGSIVTEPHHEIKGQAATGPPASRFEGSEQGSVLPFTRSAEEGAYPTSPADHSRQSHFSGAPEVQEYGSLNGSYASRPSPVGQGLDSPTTFRERRSAY